MTRVSNLKAWTTLLVVGLLGTLLVLALSACGGGASGGGEQQQANQQAKIRGCVPKCIDGGWDPGSLPPGSYTTKYFLDGYLTVTFPEPWVSHEDQQDSFIALPQGTPPGSRHLFFWLDPYPVEGKTFDVKHRAKGVPITTAGWLQWLKDNPNFRASDPQDATIGKDDLPAKVVDISLSDNAVNDEPSFAPCRRETCRGLLSWPTSAEYEYNLIGEQRVRMYLSDVEYGGKTHLLAVAIDGNSQDNLEAFAPTAERVIDSARAPISPA
jgi:hypothetical protein